MAPDRLTRDRSIIDPGDCFQRCNWVVAVAVDTSGLLLEVVVTPASVQDRDAADSLLALVRLQFPAVGKVWADGGYGSELVEYADDELGIDLEIVKRTDDLSVFLVLPRRWVVERSFGWLVKNRCLVRDYEALPASHEAMIRVTATANLARRLTQTTP